MVGRRRSRREMLKVLGSAPLAAATMQQRRSQPAVEGVVTPSPTAVRSGKPLLTLYSLSLQWADYDQAAVTAVEAGWPAIAWTVRGGGHVLPENVARDLPKAVAAAKKAGLQTPIIVTPIRDVESPFAEAYLDTMSKLGVRYYQAPPLGRYDYSKDLQPQLDAWKPRLEAVARLNEKYGTTAVYHVEGGAGNIGGGVWDLWLAIKDLDSRYVGMDYDLGHATMKGGPEAWESIRFAHRNILSIASKDIRWARKTDPPQGPRRSDPSEDWPWTAEYVVPGTGMVNFTAAFRYLKSIAFAGSFLHYSEYFVSAPGVTHPVSLLRPNVPQEVPRDLYVSNLRRDHDFFAKLLADVGF